MIELLAQQSNARNFLANVEEMKSYIGVNYIMAVNQLLRMSIYWDCYYFVGKVSIGNMFTRIRYQEVLQNLHFVDKTKQDKTDKGYKTKPIIDHLNESF